MIFLDSSYILSLIFENDINHLKAMQIRYVLVDEAKMINNTVLNEVLNSINPNNSKIEINYIINRLLSLHKIDFLNYDDYITSIKIFRYYNQSINFSDCTILKSMFENNINQIISFDSDFDKIKGIINVNF